MPWFHVHIYIYTYSISIYFQWFFSVEAWRYLIQQLDCQMVTGTLVADWDDMGFRSLPCLMTQEESCPWSGTVLENLPWWQSWLRLTIRWKTERTPLDRPSKRQACANSELPRSLLCVYYIYIYILHSHITYNVQARTFWSWSSRKDTIAPHLTFWMIRGTNCLRLGWPNSNWLYHHYILPAIMFFSFFF